MVEVNVHLRTKPPRGLFLKQHFRTPSALIKDQTVKLCAQLVTVSFILKGEAGVGFVYTYFQVLCQEQWPKKYSMASDGGIQIPNRLPLLLSHEGVLLPGSTVRFSVDSPRNMQLVSQRLLRGTSLKSTIIGVIPNTKDPEHDSDPLPTLHK